ncbi:MAG: hypothetical protein KGZ73_00905 [Rhizobiales bacterium]|nr:hypothetical protein [Hyphomicrobiales bacterium]
MRKYFNPHLTTQPESDLHNESLQTHHITARAIASRVIIAIRVPGDAIHCFSRPSRRTAANKFPVFFWIDYRRAFYDLCLRETRNTRRIWGRKYAVVITGAAVPAA